MDLKYHTVTLEATVHIVYIVIAFTYFLTIVLKEGILWYTVL